MEDSNLLQFRTLTEEEFKNIHELLIQDSSVSQYVSFSYYALVTNGIFYKGQLAGIFNLNYFIGNSIALSIALLQKYRKIGIAKATFNKIISIYGK